MAVKRSNNAISCKVSSEQCPNVLISDTCIFILCLLKLLFREILSSKVISLWLMLDIALSSVPLTPTGSCCSYLLAKYSYSRHSESLGVPGQSTEFVKKI